ncbi:MAG: hypothetical protein LBN33_10390 [Desulfovibrio sp.]|nr:hypothetical protein [Desulfovibrio sp.]
MPDREESPAYKLYNLLDSVFRRDFFQRVTPIILEGRGGSYALNRLQDSKGDGCFMSALSMPSFFFLAKSGNSLYDADGIYPLAVIASIPNALWVDEQSPLRDLDAFIEKATAETAKIDSRFAIAGAGRQTDQHLATLQMNRATGLKIPYLPLLGVKECTEAVRNGLAAACWGYAVPPEMMPGLKPLAVAAPTRSPVLPLVPTFFEARCDMQNIVLFGLALPASSPENIREKGLTELATALKDADLRSKITALGFTIPAITDPMPLLTLKERQAALKLLDEYPLFPRGESLSTVR